MAAAAAAEDEERLHHDLGTFPQLTNIYRCDEFAAAGLPGYGWKGNEALRDNSSELTDAEKLPCNLGAGDYDPGIGNSIGNFLPERDLVTLRIWLCR